MTAFEPTADAGGTSTLFACDESVKLEAYSTINFGCRRSLENFIIAVALISGA